MFKLWKAKKEAEKVKQIEELVRKYQGEVGGEEDILLASEALDKIGSEKGLLSKIAKF